MGLCIVAVFAIGMVTAASAVASNAVLAWGLNSSGQLGNGTTTSSDVPLQVKGLNGIGILSGVTAISGGSDYSLALLKSGEVAAWGSNEYEQLGDGTNANSDVPVKVCAAGTVGACPSGPYLGEGGAGREVTAISAGRYHSLALLGSGEVVAWGYNPEGELGNGTTASSNVPVKVCAVGTVGSCPTGGPYLGEGGIGHEVTAISADGFHSLARLGNGEVRAWGSEGSGELGNGSCFGSSDVPVEVTGLNGTGTLSGVSGAMPVSSGEYHSLALLGNGEVRAWGDNGYGQLGNPTDDCGLNPNSDVPVEVDGVNGIGTLSGVTAISAGSYYSLALLGTGEVRAWGYNREGELGDGTSTGPQTCNGSYPCSTTPVEVNGPNDIGTLSGVTAISAGWEHNLALLSHSEVMAWGSGYSGALGNGATANSDWPVQVKGLNGIGTLSGVTAISAGEYHSLALSPLPPPEFEGPPNNFPKQFKSEEDQSVFDFTGGKIKCESDKDKGEVTEPTTLTEEITFKTCKYDGTSKCEKPGGGEPETGPLEGFIGFINKTTTEVGLELKPKGATTVLIEFACLSGNVKIKVEGSVVGVFKQDDLNVSTKKFTVTFSQANAQQALHELEGGPSDEPECKIGANPQKCGFESKDEITFAKKTTLIP